MKVTIRNKRDGSIYRTHTSSRIATRNSTTLYNSIEIVVYSDGVSDNSSFAYPVSSFDVEVSK